MGNDFHWLYGLSGFLVAFLVTGVIFLLFNKYGKKRRLFDERYHNIHMKGRSIAWSISTMCIIGAWVFVLMVDGANLAFFTLTFVYIAHMVAYIIGAAFAQSKI